MEALAAALIEGFAVDGPTVAVVGMLRGRDPSAMLSAIAPIGIRTLFACAPNSPRALAPEVIAEAGRALGMDVEVAGSVSDAILAARPQVPDDGMLVVAGSLYVVADARTLLLDAARQQLMAEPPRGRRRVLVGCSTRGTHARDHQAGRGRARD